MTLTTKTFFTTLTLSGLFCINGLQSADNLKSNLLANAATAGAVCAVGYFSYKGLSYIHSGWQTLTNAAALQKRIATLEEKNRLNNISNNRRIEGLEEQNKDILNWATQHCSDINMCENAIQCLSEKYKKQGLDSNKLDTKVTNLDTQINTLENSYASKIAYITTALTGNKKEAKQACALLRGAQ